jgi:hypothetical protein
MRTTDPSAPAYKRSGTGASLRHYLTALLAAFYVVVWWVLASRPPRSPDAETLAPPFRPDARPHANAVVWYQDLAPSDRPPVLLPPGWRLAEKDSWRVERAQESPPVPVPVPRERIGRIRTRSS